MLHSFLFSEAHLLFACIYTSSSTSTHRTQLPYLVHEDEPTICSSNQVSFLFPIALLGVSIWMSSPSGCHHVVWPLKFNNLSYSLRLYIRSWYPDFPETLDQNTRAIFDSLSYFNLNQVPLIILLQYFTHLYL